MEIRAYWGVKDASLAPEVVAADTWPNHVAVYHLGEGDKTAYDSSGNGYNAINAAAVTLGDEPRVGGCASIHDMYKTDITDFTNPSANKPLNDRSRVTFSAWVAIDKINTASDTYAQNTRVEIARKFDATKRGQGGFSCRYFADNSYSSKAHEVRPLFGIYMDYGTGSNTAENWNDKADESAGSWLYLTCTVDGASVAKYINGAKMYTPGSTNPRTLSHGILAPDSIPFDFGAADNSINCQAYARMDEMRIRNGAATPEWVAADYAQQSDDTFLTYEGMVDESFVVSPIPDQLIPANFDLSKGVMPDIIVSNVDEHIELVLNKDYTVTYTDNTSAGTAYVTIAGLGEYSAYINTYAFKISILKEYFIVADANVDSVNTSSISGESSATGWSTTKGGTKAISGITEEKAVYYIWTNRWNRSPPNKNFSTPLSTKIIIEPNCRWEIACKLQTKNVTFNNLIIRNNGQLVITPSSDGAPHNNTYGGDYSLDEGASIFIPATLLSSNSYKQYILSAKVSGRGEIAMPSDLDQLGYSGALLNKITGNISNFKGDLKTWNSLDNEFTLELVNEESIPGDPDPNDIAYVVVTNTAKLKIDQNWVSPTNRIWILGNEGKPTIDVAEGKTVEIKGDIIGSAGFIKTGNGILVLHRNSPELTGEITISGGALRLSGTSSSLLGSQNITFKENGGSLVAAGFYISPIPDQEVYSLEELASGIKPSIVVSDLDKGIELVLGTDYTVSYSDNTECGIATAIATGIGDYAGSERRAPFAIHTVRQLTQPYNLTADEDWTNFESICLVSAGVSIDLKGHKLKVTGLSGKGQITDTVGGGELHYYVPTTYKTGYEATSGVKLNGQLKLVKLGPGLLNCNVLGQGYTGGTDILEGILRIGISPGSTMDIAAPIGYNTAQEHNKVYLGPNGILDPASIAGWAYHDLTIDGGMISNTVANTQLPGIARCFNPECNVSNDFSFVTTEQYGWKIGELNGHTVTVAIAPNKILYLLSEANLQTSGRLNIVRGGKIGTLANYSPGLSTVDFDEFNAAFTLVSAINMHDYRPTYTENIGNGGKEVNVYGTFTPDSDYFYGPTMQDGSTINLSKKTQTWDLSSLLDDKNSRTTKFAPDAIINIELGNRNLAREEKIISWSAQPDTTFASKRWRFESRADGLYIKNRIGIGSVITIR